MIKLPLSIGPTSKTRPAGECSLIRDTFGYNEIEIKGYAFEDVSVCVLARLRYRQRPPLNHRCMLPLNQVDILNLLATYSDTDLCTEKADIRKG